MWKCFGKAGKLSKARERDKVVRMWKAGTGAEERRRWGEKGRRGEGHLWVGRAGGVYLGLGGRVRGWTGTCCRWRMQD